MKNQRHPTDGTPVPDESPETIKHTEEEIKIPVAETHETPGKKVDTNEKPTGSTDEELPQSPGTEVHGTTEEK